MVRLRFFIMGLLISLFLSMSYLSCFESSSAFNKVSIYAEDDFLKSWKVLSPKPVEDDIFSVHFAGRAAVASLYGGKIIYSENAMMTIQYYSLPQADVLNDITDFSNNFVGVSSLGKMYKSSDGKSWSVVTGEALNNPLTSVASGNEVIAVGFGGIIISSKDLSSYTKKSTNTQNNLLDIAVSDSNSYVVVGEKSIVCLSPDGNTFTCSTTSAGADIVSVAYGDGKFVAVTSNNKLMVSTDSGANWTISDLGFTGVISRIEYFNNEFIIYGLNGLIATSATGDSFNKLSVSTAYSIFDVTYDGSLYYLVGPGGLVLTTSHPSLGFIKISPDIAGDLFAIYKGLNYYVVGGRGGTVAYSDDGLDFYNVSSTEIDNDIKAIASDKNVNNEQFCAVANGGFIYRTNDITGGWTGYHLSGSNDFNDIIFALSRFILAGDAGTLYVSGDCINFLQVNTGSQSNFKRILFDGTNILLSGSNGTLYKSTNPSGPYSKISFPVTYNIVDMAYGNGIYLFLTQEKVSDYVYNSRIYKSTDLSNFTLAKEYLSVKLTRAAFGAGYFIFTSGFGNVYYTKDGQTFSMTATGKYKEFLNAVFLEKAFYLSGKDGLLIKSGDNLAGLEPEISVSVTEIDFGDVVINSSSNVESVVVTNIGKGDLSISKVTLTGNDANQFNIESDSCSSSTLKESEECIIYVDFRPTSVGSKSAGLNITSNDRTHPIFTVRLAGRGVMPQSGVISLDKSSIDFGIVKVGNESTVQNVVVKNVGTLDLSIGSVYLGGNDTSDFEIRSDNCNSTTLTPNNSCTIGLVFKPQSLGNKSAELLIDSDDPTRPTAKVILSGSGIDRDYPNIVVDNNQVDFGIVKLGSESDIKSLMVSNNGSAGLNITDVVIDGNNSADFIIKNDGCKAKILTPSSSCKIDLAFKPQSVGNESATLKISSNDPDTPQYTVNLYGTGRAAGGPAINVSPMSLDFGKINTGYESAAQDITIKSEGDSDLSITAVNLGGNDKDQFVIKSNNCPLKLAPNNSCKVSVSFKPTKSGVKSAEIQISSDDPTFAQVNVSLTGEGVVNKPSAISVTPSSYDFGKRIIGKVYPPVTFTVKNEGTGNLSIDSVLIEGMDAPVFKIESDDCSKNQFIPDGSCYIKVSFNPVDEISYSVNLVINSNDSTKPKFEVPLKGAGIKGEREDAGVTEDIASEEETGTQPISDTKSKDESTSGCGCSIVE